jgi:hypothetical protein
MMRRGSDFTKVIHLYSLYKEAGSAGKDTRRIYLRLGKMLSSLVFILVRQTNIKNLDMDIICLTD